MKQFQSTFWNLNISENEYIYALFSGRTSRQ